MRKPWRTDRTDRDRPEQRGLRRLASSILWVGEIGADHPKPRGGRLTNVSRCRPGQLPIFANHVRRRNVTLAAAWSHPPADKQPHLLQTRNRYPGGTNGAIRALAVLPMVTALSPRRHCPGALDRMPTCAKLRVGRRGFGSAGRLTRRRRTSRPECRASWPCQPGCPGCRCRGTP